MDKLTREARSKLMSKIRSKGNASTELKLIALFRQHGIKGWRRNFNLFGSPDIVFPKFKAAIFVDGCFWHGCPICGRLPKTNKKYWSPKIERNKRRDRKVNIELRKKKWAVIRIKECMLKKYPCAQIKRILSIINP